MEEANAILIFNPPSSKGTKRRDSWKNCILTVACGDYDRTHALANGCRGSGRDSPQLPSAGSRRDLLAHGPPSGVRRLGDVSLEPRDDGQPWQLSVCCASRCFRRASSAIPVYLSTLTPGSKALRTSTARRIGAPEYSITAAVWIRGFLNDDYGVRAQDIALVCRRSGRSRSKGTGQADPARRDQGRCYSRRQDS